MRSEIRYAKSNGVSIAYQVVGDGPKDILHIPGFVSHLECAWEQPDLTYWYERLATSARLILFDKRGTGLSDRVGVATLEERMDDVRAVMDAAGSDRAAIFSVSEGGPLSVLFAATYPERTTALAIYGTAAARAWEPDEPGAPMPAVYDDYLATMEEEWGQPNSQIIASNAPSRIEDASFRSWLARHFRLGASPGAAVDLMRIYAEIDVRAAAGALRVPTLVLHRTGDLICSVDQGHDLAQRIPGARYVELPGCDHIWHVGQTETLIREVEAFFAITSPTPEPIGTVLATILCAELTSPFAPGPPNARHAAMMRDLVAGFGGRPMSHDGKFFVATFQGPARAVRCAMAMRESFGGLGLGFRAGLHAGECQVDGDVLGGAAALVCAEVRAMATPGELLVSSAVKELAVGSGLRFAMQGLLHTTEGGEWPLFAVLHQDVDTPGQASPNGLTERELEVLRLLATGKTNREIAEELVVSVNTVERHITHIYSKIGAANRVEAADWARRNILY